MLLKRLASKTILVSFGDFISAHSRSANCHMNYLLRTLMTRKGGRALANSLSRDWSLSSSTVHQGLDAANIQGEYIGGSEFC